MTLDQKSDLLHAVAKSAEQEEIDESNPPKNQQLTQEQIEKERLETAEQLSAESIELEKKDFSAKELKDFSKFTSENAEKTFKQPNIAPAIHLDQKKEQPKNFYEQILLKKEESKKEEAKKEEAKKEEAKKEAKKEEAKKEESKKEEAKKEEVKKAEK